MTARDQIIDIIMDRTPGWFERERAEGMTDDILSSVEVETLRDKFAGQAMASILRNNQGTNIGTNIGVKRLSELSYEVADAMITERKRV